MCMLMRTHMHMYVLVCDIPSRIPPRCHRGMRAEMIVVSALVHLPGNERVCECVWEKDTQKKSGCDQLGQMVCRAAKSGV